MAASRYKGPVAFPFAGSDGHSLNDAGMLLRDYFAAKAMAAMITTSNGPCMVGGLQGAESEAAKSAYKMADAMLIERSK